MTQHREILDAIVKGEAARAERTMRNHVRHTVEVSRRLPDALFRT